VAKTVAKKARVVLTSGGLEPVADSGGGKNSIFAASLLKVLRDNTGIIDGTDVHKKLVRPVKLESDQDPQYESIGKCGHQEGADFFFVRKGSKLPAAGAASAGGDSAEAAELRRKLAEAEAARQAAEARAREAAKNRPPKAPESVPGVEFEQEWAGPNLVLIVVASGAGSSGDAARQKIGSRKAALKKIEKALKAVLSQPPYGMSRRAIGRVYDGGEMIDLSYDSVGNKTTAEVTYQVTLPEDVSARLKGK
jgi:hypothetical protein